MILAAGMGNRLLEVTKEIPKPLVKLSDKKRIIDVAVDNLIRIGIDEIAVNLYYKGELIEKYLTANYPEVLWNFLYEEELLNTGGGIANAKDFLTQHETSIIINSDILFFSDLTKYIEQHKGSEAIAGMIIVPDNPLKNAVVFDKKKRIRGFCNSQNKLLYEMNKFSSAKDKLGTFSGIQILNREFVETLQVGKYSIIDVYVRMIKSGEKINAISFGDNFWYDLGTPERLRFARKLFSLLASSFPTNMIAELEKVFEGASEKKIYRIIKKDDSSVILITSSDVKELNTWNDFSSFFENTDFNVPRVIKKGKEYLFVTDAGRESLFDLVQIYGLRNPKITKYYDQALQFLKTLSDIEIKDFPVDSCYPVREFDLANICFDLNLLNENYFNNQLSGKEIISIAEVIENEFKKLPKAIMHRDFQSTNLMIKEKKITVVDIQSMRIGYSIYDLASLLFDSNIPFDAEFIQKYKREYFQIIGSESEMQFWITAFIRVVHDLGIFARIGRKKMFFREKIRAAEIRLQYILKFFCDSGQSKAILHVAKRLYKRDQTGLFDIHL